MPSVVRFPNHRDDPLIGFPALRGTTPKNSDDDKNETNSSDSSSNSVLRSVKRLLGKRYGDLDPAWIDTLDFEVRNPSEFDNNDNGDDASLQLVPRTGGSCREETISVTPQEVLILELKAIRTACQVYLDKHRRSKNLRVPGGESADDTDHERPLVENVVVGVPAHFSHRHIGLVKDACREAGFRGHVGTCLESTAAAISYGLTLQERSKTWSSASASVSDSSPTTTTGGPTIMVVDMGGGTTDITIATCRKNLDADANADANADADAEEMNEMDSDSNLVSSYRVLLTQGDDRLGGDDIDESMMDYCLDQVVPGEHLESNEKRKIGKSKGDVLKLACRAAKESLCSLEDPSPSETVITKGKEVQITQEIFDTIILQPWLERARDLISKARDALHETNTTKDITIDEVILVGGTTRIPAIRRMIQTLFPEIELSSSLNPMSSVAQGLAIQAAILSKRIPLHELKSAMMLDCVPHAIGVEMQHNGGFVEIIPRNTLLPAAGSATFVLADKFQRGVTIRAVEEVGRSTYEPMRKEDFSFVLRKLSGAQFETMTDRTIQVGMKLDIDGRFVVSVFDENDPEQVRRRDRFERIQNGQAVVGELDYIKDMILAESDGITNEQIVLFVALISLFVLYVAVKMAFVDPLEHGSTILE
mmetsp:Transcript_1054/g.2706  ORF Transcript_1054/g.2706 Transcript_1054/m.2706 type:complete len:650 (-) Transcript_1054:755-2704(-)